MDLLLLIVGLVAVGFGVWALTTKVPMLAGWATAIQWFAVVVIVLYLFMRFAPNLPNMLPAHR